ncbi:MAG TPA: hypothetical protein PKK40_09060, partial [Marmoricola sp.]|nr:hypothetical protein [Marmoricola sp.]
MRHNTIEPRPAPAGRRSLRGGWLRRTLRCSATHVVRSVADPFEVAGFVVRSPPARCSATDP